MKTVAVSGGFDPLHPGHIAFFERAKQLGDRLVVIVDNDETVALKHKVMQTQLHRARIVGGLRCVDHVALGKTLGDCSVELECLTRHVFAVGYDHSDVKSLPEWATCEKLGISIVCIDTLKLSSSALIAKVQWGNPPVTVSVIPRYADNVLVAVRGQHDGKGKLMLVGGFLEQGETLEEAARRETKEEIGMDVSNLEYFDSRVGTYSDGRKVLAVTFLCNFNRRPRFDNLVLTSKEASSAFWVGDMPVAEFAFECDRQVLQKFFEERAI